MPEPHQAPIAFETSCVVAASLDEVHRHLSDPNSYIGLSPLIVAVRDVRPGRDAQGRAIVDYLAVERFRLFGPVRWDNVIRVRLTPQPPDRLVSDVRSPGWVRLRAVVELAAVADGTQVREQITAFAPAPLRRFVAAQARQAAAHRATELPHRIPPPPPPPPPDPHPHPTVDHEVGGTSRSSKCR
ncbi:SRPBCC family protein [Micromonospora sp. FIMYZ51]|uniref:SRPBCC family protein n=1 Tax=Micromonospora sp. FIMYZ51 TaxID=3051832 RepID=UPI00311E32EF